jgi:hypothetical protein
MSQTPLTQFSLDERARVPLQFLLQAAGMTGMWVMTREVIAPLLGVRIMSPVEAFYNLVWKVFQSVMASSAPSVAGEVSPVGPAMQLAFSGLLWMFPIAVAVSGMATIWTAVEYGVDRVAGPPAVADHGGEV